MNVADGSGTTTIKKQDVLDERKGELKSMQKKRRILLWSQTGHNSREKQGE